MTAIHSSTTRPRFEILPFGSGEEEAARLPEPARLTVTCSPRHGIDHTVDVAVRLRERGHSVVVHVAARMVRGGGHVDELLGRTSAAGIDDLFVVGGDAETPDGPYASAVELLPVIHEHRLRPPALGIAAYPEGHATIDDSVLEAALREKGQLATYMATQLCFDAAALLRWLERTRAAGLALPVFVGIPGAVDRRKLLEISLRVGVGPSVSFIRKQRGLKQLLGRPSHAAQALHEALLPHLDDPEWGIAGWHYFTFNRLVETWEWDRRWAPADHGTTATALRDARSSPRM